MNFRCLFTGHDFEYIRNKEGCKHSGWTNIHYYGYVARLYTCKHCSEEKEVLIEKTNECFF